MMSIFTIERRRDFKDSFVNFFEDLNSVVSTSNGDSYKMFEYLNRCLRYWPHRCGATGIDDYLKGIGIDITNPKEDRDLLLTLELLINLLHWAPKQDYIDNRNSEFVISLKKNDVENESSRLIHNAEYILEQCCNMKVREDPNVDFPKYFITKRNSYVDAALIAVPELSDSLLGYFDVRNEGDIEYKKNVLTALYGYMEPHRKEYRSLACSSISEEFFACMNAFGIRHNTKSQIRMQSKKKNIVCDWLFLMAIYVLQTVTVNDYKNALKEMREKSSKSD